MEEKKVATPYLNIAFTQMQTVIAECIKRQENCSCSVAMKYQPELEADQQYKLTIFCDTQEASSFVNETDLILDQHVTIPSVKLVKSEALPSPSDD